MMTCEQIRELLDEYRMKRLGSEETTSVAAHLAECATCSNELARLHELNEMLSGVIFENPGDAYFTAMQEKLKQRIAAEENAASLGQPSAPSAKVMEMKDRVPRRYRWMEIAAAFLIGASAMLLLQSIEEHQTVSEETHITLSRKKELAFATDATLEVDKDEAKKAESSTAGSAPAISPPSGREDLFAREVIIAEDKQVENEDARKAAQPMASAELPRSEPVTSPPRTALAPSLNSEMGVMAPAPATAAATQRNLAKASTASASVGETSIAPTTMSRLNSMALLQDITRTADGYKPSPPVDVSDALAATQAAPPAPDTVHVWRSQTLSSATPSTPTLSTNLVPHYLAAEDAASAGSVSDAIAKFREVASGKTDGHLALRATLRIAELQEATGEIPLALESYRKCLQPPLISHASPALRDEIERRIARLVVR